MHLKIGITKTFVVIAFATMSFGPWYFGNLVAFAADPSLAQKRFCVGELFRRAMGRPTPIEQIMTEIRESVQILDPKFGSVQVGLPSQTIEQNLEPVARAKMNNEFRYVEMLADRGKRALTVADLAQINAGLREIPLTAGDKNTRGVRGIAFSAEAKHWDADLQKATARYTLSDRVPEMLQKWEKLQTLTWESSLHEEAILSIHPFADANGRVAQVVGHFFSYLRLKYANEQQSPAR